MRALSAVIALNIVCAVGLATQPAAAHGLPGPASARTFHSVRHHDALTFNPSSRVAQLPSGRTLRFARRSGIALLRARATWRGLRYRTGAAIGRIGHSLRNKQLGERVVLAGKRLGGLEVSLHNTGSVTGRDGLHRVAQYEIRPFEARPVGALEMASSSMHDIGRNQWMYVQPDSNFYDHETGAQQSQKARYLGERRLEGVKTRYDRQGVQQGEPEVWVKQY